MHTSPKYLAAKASQNRTFPSKFSLSLLLRTSTYTERGKSGKIPDLLYHVGCPVDASPWGLHPLGQQLGGPIIASDLHAVSKCIKDGWNTAKETLNDDYYPIILCAKVLYKKRKVQPCNGVSPDCLGVLLGAGIMAFPLGEQETGKTGGFLSRLIDVLARKPGKLVFTPHSVFL